MFSKFDEEAKKVLVNMQKEMVSLKHPYIGSEHLLLSLLKYGSSDYVKKFKAKKYVVRNAGIFGFTDSTFIRKPKTKEMIK